MLYTKAAVLSTRGILELGVKIDGISIHNLLPRSMASTLRLPLHFGKSIRIVVANHIIPTNNIVDLISEWLLRRWHTSSYGTHDLMLCDARLAWRPLYLRAFSSSSSSSFFSFRFLYYRLPIERAFALFLMRHRSTID
jgi:hypothetical protein